MANAPAKEKPAPAAKPTEQPAADPNSFDSKKWLSEQAEKTVEFVPFGKEDPIRLSAKLVLRYLCPPTKSGKQCTEEQAVKFVMLCKSRGLDPWEGDAYIVGYDGQHGPVFSLITAHQAFLKRAEAHLQYDGMKSGVLVMRGTEVVELEGDFFNGDDKLVGGWARVFRKDRTHPTVRKVKLGTFDTKRSRWEADPGGMICKVAECHALRDTFPNNLAGLYTHGEMPDEETRDAAPAPVTAKERVAQIKAPKVEPKPDPAANGHAEPAPERQPGEDPIDDGINEPPNLPPQGDMFGGDQRENLR
jgi:phage recombination protein Bet